MLKQSSLLYGLTFISGMCIMAVELTASRIMAPYFGTSHYVWTNVIAVILAALAAGYALGGKLSERSPHLQTLLSIIMLASMMLVTIPYILPLLGQNAILGLIVTQNPMYAILFQSFLVTVLVFFLPIMMLGMVSPFIIKLFSQNESHMGDVSGKVFAIGTVGSFLGTFLPSVVTIPAIGSKRTILLFALILFMTALLGMARRKAFALVMIPFASGFSDAHMPMLMPKGATLLAESETPYQYIRVIQKEDGLRYMSFNESLSMQSVYNPNGGATSTYYDQMAQTPELLKKAQQGQPFSVLILGLAGGTIARTIKDTYGEQARVVGVEIDQKVVEYGKQFMALGDHHGTSDAETIEIHIDDARNFLRTTPDEYDVIIVDAYSNQLTIPFHLATQEFYTLLKSKIAPGGFAAMNVNDISSEGRIIGSIAKTAHSVLGPTGMQNVDAYLNHILIAPWEPNYHEYGLYTPTQGQILTDDLAPLEKMADSMIWRYYRGNIE